MAVTLAAATVLTPACGGGGPAAPAAPAPRAFGLPDGKYSLLVRAPFSLEDCTGAWENSALSNREVQVLLKREGDEWLAHAELPRDGDIVFRLRDAPGPGALRLLTGSIEGTAITAGVDRIDLGVSFNPDGVGPAAAEGLGYPGVPFATGTLTGSIMFIDSSREPMTCQTATWRVTPASFSPGT